MFLRKVFHLCIFSEIAKVDASFSIQHLSPMKYQIWSRIWNVTPFLLCNVYSYLSCISKCCLMAFGNLFTNQISLHTNIEITTGLIHYVSNPYNHYHLKFNIIFMNVLSCSFYLKWSSIFISSKPNKRSLENYHKINLPTINTSYMVPKQLKRLIIKSYFYSMLER